MSFIGSVKATWRRIISTGSQPPLPPITQPAAQPPAASPAALAAAPATLTPVTTGRILLIHGYSASGAAFKPWKDKLAAAGIATLSIEVGNYVTLNNEVSIKDLGEAFDRALRYAPWNTDGKDATWTFDAVVHSTGMLVLRQWLTSDPYTRDDPRSRIKRLKHLVGLAPATFGSPQAKQGRSWLGALVKGSKHFGPDFLNAGDEVLAGLELASSYTWDLTHKDMLCSNPLYDKGAGTPYVAIFIGNTEYTWISSVANSPGCDGTVRWAGCALNTRKVSIDFRREPKLLDKDNNPIRYDLSPWESNRLGAPMIAVDGKNHGTILDTPDDTVCDLMKDFFVITDDDAYTAWEARAQAAGADALKKMDDAATIDGAQGAGWQQLVLHVVDDHGDGVADFNLQLFIGDNLTDSDDPAYKSVPLIADTFSRDGSYRCFYIRLSEQMLTLNAPGTPPKKMWLELIASSGSNMIEYEAYTGQPGSSNPPQPLAVDHAGGKAVKLDITDLALGQEKLLFPYTTTLIEIFVEREPWPLDNVTELFNFLA